MTRSRCGTLAVLTFIFAASPCAAQTDEQLEQARAQFREGVELIEQEQWDEALTRFRAVAEVRRTPQVLYNLALALSHTTGGGAEASRILAEVVRDPETDDATEERAQARLEQIQSNVAGLIIRIRGDEAGTRVTVDGQDVGLAELGRPYQVEPGSHVVELRWGRRVRDHQDIDLGPGATEEIELDANGRYEEMQLEAALEQSGADSAGSEEVTDQWWFWTAIGVGAAVILGLVIGFAASGGNEPEAVSGNLDPGIIRVMP